ncbi:GAF protein, variant 3 [Blastomyces dermatitidis ER-3]|uniref:GAF protein, variant 2 n=3 Tax=Blastomyces TaxID=229219 RepID=A0A179U7W4_BLAGS|nr:GAF protein, variant 2 [Blastomyces gilchristii SLH14081]XP_045281616.1 GAF protein, variant 3 [Blastomyces dermatitidis ER-3]EQL30626.1 GAF domain-containing protein, variant 3 [Blastomyces dermatitidis ATCC 26199]KMW69394.1 GAF protein, variant [Blastomyces dermatitidis ATCC 18188]OAT01889.1 GAF protein, variant 3 [Blastomyces dermatitidis ER-3]OAT04115.1 GAF protein, variant 2 [Blastomyces gilchristii SLH14081]
MPHADSSYFAPGLSKAEVYSQVLEQAKGLLDGQRNWVSNLANVASLLWHAYAALPTPSSNVNWAGFYVRQDKFPSLASPDSDTKGTPNVLNWEGHIACDAESRSEIVVPILVNGETVAIIDVDCTQPSGFDDVDRQWLEALAAILSDSCDW